MAVPQLRLNIYDAVAANRWRTLLLIAGFTVIVALLAYVGGEYLSPGYGPAMLPFAVGLSGVSAAASYFAGDKLVLAQSQARELAAGEEPELRSVVEALSIGLGIQPPKLYVIEDSAPNAFATGRDPAHASVAVTRGLLDKLSSIQHAGYARIPGRPRLRRRDRPRRPPRPGSRTASLALAGARRRSRRARSETCEAPRSMRLRPS